MINEIDMHKLKKRLDELDKIMEDHLKKGLILPQHIKTEYRETADKYNAYVKIDLQQRGEEFMKAIQDEKLDLEAAKKGDVPF